MKTAFHSCQVGFTAGSTTVGLSDHPKTMTRGLLGQNQSRQKQSVGEVKAPKADSSSLSETIRLAQQGDASAFELIYRLHCRRVYALCLRMLRDPVEAEDFTQEAFMQLFRKIHTFRGESAFASWLYRLTANIVLMKFRKKKLMSTSLDDLTKDQEDGRPGKEFGAPDLRLTSLFDRVNLQAAIKQLPAGYKAMFLLHDVHGYAHNEIAEILGCSIGNSKSQLHKARIRLRQLLHKAQHHGAQHNGEPKGGPIAVAVAHSVLDLNGAMPVTS
jgi:RNA polymerase sigma-70 factor, ECF subfamily